MQFKQQSNSVWPEDAAFSSKANVTQSTIAIETYDMQQEKWCIQEKDLFAKAMCSKSHVLDLYFFD